MARYESEFEGIPGGFSAPTGMDPNYRDGYRGMRMQGEPGQAAYGLYRSLRSADLETAGGFEGIHDPTEMGGLVTGDIQPGGGGVRDPFTDAGFLHDFDSRGQRFAADPPDTRADLEFPLSSDVDRPGGEAEGPIDPDYGNRGIPPGGYSEGWARGPTRGGR
jgi:hypothetical protein